MCINGKYRDIVLMAVLNHEPAPGNEQISDHEPVPDNGENA